MNRRRWDGEDGQITAFVVIFTAALLFVAGLVIDGGAVLTTKRQAINEAEQAARAGTQGLAVEAVRATGAQTLDPQRAAAAARAYLDGIGRDGAVTVAGDRVTVTVQIPRRLVILGIGGLREVSVSGHATARNVRGVTQGET